MRLPIRRLWLKSIDVGDARVVSIKRNSPFYQPSASHLSAVNLAVDGTYLIIIKGFATCSSRALPTWQCGKVAMKTFKCKWSRWAEISGGIVKIQHSGCFVKLILSHMYNLITENDLHWHWFQPLILSPYFSLVSNPWRKNVNTLRLRETLATRPVTATGSQYFRPFSTYLA